MFSLFKKKVSSALPEKTLSNKQELAYEIIGTSLGLGRGCFEYFSKNNQSKRNLSELVNEFIYIFLHLTNRFSYSRGGRRAQETVYDDVAKQVLTELVRRSESEQQSKVLELHLAGIAETENIYGKCTSLIADEGESMMNALLWVAAKRVAQSEDIAKIIYVTELISAGINALKIQDKVEFILKDKHS